MKFFVPLTLLVAAGVSADGTASCDADFIVTQCLSTELPKAQACKTTDYDCLCAAYQSIATCYNNCPNDPRVSTAQGQVTQFCMNASVFGDRAVAAKTAAAAAAAKSDTSSPDTTDSEEAPAQTSSSRRPAASKSAATGTTSAPAAVNTNAAALARSGSAGGALVVAGVVAALL
ncbi:hypothetical protein DCS_01517 [Drechmeria coniospora]|uniref:GPI anchored serine-threonine rich protein n=1 Tax=Drechmeria coniospora TaxID=98403 RepID=A0A151GTI0_DRECN|nr:hypothetical protein DCS_01517 [Drechmeria coniospora]KYK60380.1 hypothetical protein DCS_01517 [Drechmeria coniospora]ODA80321.1 hypothetical protein RJ55_03279 [Drechmeria coniospora]